MKRLVLFILLGALGAPSFAHQIKSAITSVLFNPNSQNLEVMHRFYLHDAEHAVHHVFGKDADIISSEATQSEFAEYVMERFSIQNEGEAVNLSAVGHEVEGKFFWVYQETPLLENVKQLTFTHNALRDIWSGQINTLNVEGLINGEKSLKTLTFKGNTELLKVEF